MRSGFCLALEHVDAFRGIALHEVARILEPGGRFVLLLCHPLLQAPGSGWVDERSGPGEHYWPASGASVPKPRGIEPSSRPA